MSEQEDPERTLEEMESRADELDEQLEDVKEDWEAKKSSDSVPGAQEED